MSHEPKRTATEQLEANLAEAAARAEEARIRVFLKDCACPCCEARARLRAISYIRAERSPAEIHCASTDPDYCKHCDDEDLLAARLLAVRLLPKEAIRAAAKEYHETDTDAR